jgi:uncharacterized protein YyaL (SSP411 family)
MTKHENAAKKAVEFILKRMCSSTGRLYHRYRDGEAAIPGFLDDYAFFVWSLMEVYETTFQVKYLKLAIKYAEEMVKYFWDEKNGGFYFTAKDTDEVLLREKEIYDNVYPSGNSITTYVLLLLYRITGKEDFEHKYDETLKKFSHQISQNPPAHTHFLMLLDFLLGPSYEVVIVGNPKEQNTIKMISALNNSFTPNKVVLLRPESTKKPAITQYAPFTEPLTKKDNKATAYVCRNYQCELPTTNITKMLELFK